MKIPSELTREQLEAIVGRIQIILWLDHREGVLDPDLSWESETLRVCRRRDGGRRSQARSCHAGGGSRP